MEEKIKLKALEIYKQNKQALDLVFAIGASKVVANLSKKLPERAEMLAINDELDRLQADPNLIKLVKALGGINFFEITGMARREIHHSELLSYLFDANGKHGLGDCIFKSFLDQIVDVKIKKPNVKDFGTFKIRREWENIDILLFSKTERIVFVIENKIFSGERIDAERVAFDKVQQVQGQLKDYRQKITEKGGEFENYTPYFIFLTPNSIPPSKENGDYWATADYNMIVNAINALLSNAKAQFDVEIMLRHYVAMLRKNKIAVRDIENISKEIYAKNELSLLFLNSVVIWKQINVCIVDYLMQKEKNAALRLVAESGKPKDYGKNYDKIIYFTIDGIDKQLQNTNWIRFAIQLNDDQNLNYRAEVYADIRMNDRNDKKAVKIIANYKSKKAATRLRVFGDRNVTSKKLAYRDFFENWFGDTGEVNDLLDNLFDEIAAFEAELAKI